MADRVLVTGGGRSGKSAYAEKLAEAITGPRTYIATCPVFENDDEMTERVNRHQSDRQGKGWTTIEETIDLPHAMSLAEPHGVILVDCLTLWVNNLMYQAELEDKHFGENEMVEITDRMLSSAQSYYGTIIFVSNEVGLGIIPANAIARCFRDCAGRCNQRVAAAADRVTFMACGLPMQLK